MSDQQQPAGDDLGTPEAVARAAALDLGLAENDSQLAQCVAAAIAYYRRYRPTAKITPEIALGLSKLAQGLYRDARKPGVLDAYNDQSNVFNRATDVQIEQLLRIGRYAPPQIG